MATEILIVWPQAKAAGQLHEAVLRSGLGMRPRILEYYPDRTRLAEIAASEEAVKAIVVGMSARERALQVLRAVHTDSPGILAIAAHTSESADLLRDVMRAGASDCLVPPFQAADIQRCFQPIAASAPAGPGGALIAISPCQGTDGASTVALHIAQNLSEASGRAALLVDCDVQCGVVAFRLGVHPKYTLADALAHAETLDEFLSKIAVRWRDFDLIAAPDSPLGLMGDHMERLPQTLGAMRRHYPAVIADMPPGLYAAGVEVLLQADQIHLVCTPEITSLHLARRRISELLDTGAEKERIRVTVNRTGSRKAVPAREIERAIGMTVHHTLANDYDAVTEAAVAGGLIAPDSRLGKDLRALATRIVGVEPKPDRRPASSWKRLLRFG